MGDLAFYQCNNLSDVQFSPETAHIGDCPFFGCDSLSHIYVPDNNIYFTFEQNALFNKDKTTLIFCLSICEGTYNIANSVKYIHRLAFSACNKISQVILPNTITHIEELAFFECTNLSKLVLPEGLVAIGDWAIAHCHSLISVSIPSTIRTIPRSLFDDCNSIRELFVQFEDPYAVDVDSKAFVSLYSQCTLFVPRGHRWSYRQHPTWGSFESIQIIDALAF